MGYKVDFDALDSFNTNINAQINTWSEQLEEVSGAVATLQGSANMSGSGADNIKAYFENVHCVILSLIGQLLAGQQNNCFLYKRDYFTNVDTDLHAVIKETEILDIKSKITTQKVKSIDVDGSIADALNKIKDIFYVSYKDISYVDAAHKRIEDFISDLDTEIKTLEDTHYLQDFDDTDQLIAALKTFITEQKLQGRTYKSDFSVEKLAGSESFKSLYDAYVAVNKEQESKADLLAEEIKNEEQRVADLQAEYEERQKKATVIKWIVTGVCIIGSVIAIAATGGAATPLVVGAISAVSGAVMAGANNLADQYVEHGNLIENSDKIDWGSFGKDVAVAGITGFVTGAVGAGVGGAITSKLGSTAVGNSLLHSSSSLVRIGTGAVIGAVSEVGSGVVSRTASTFITSGDVKESLEAGFDGKQMLVDAAIGGVGGGIDQYATTKRAQNAADEYAIDYNQKHNPIKDGEANGLENLKQTPNGGVDFSDSDYILRTETGEPIQVKIKSTGDRNQDYKLAEKILKEEYGVDIDLKSMRTGSQKTHVWHHMDDYNVATNETTMQFIEIKAHQGIKQHAGSAKQYHIANGSGYGKDSFDADYSLNITGQIGSVNSNVSTNMENNANMPNTTYQAYDGAGSRWGNADAVFQRLGLAT